MHKLIISFFLIFALSAVSLAGEKPSITSSPMDQNAARFCYYGSQDPYSQGSHIKMQDGNIYECGMNRLDVSSKDLVWNVIVDEKEKISKDEKLNTLDNMTP